MRKIKLILTASILLLVSGHASASIIRVDMNISAEFVLDPSVDQGATILEDVGLSLIYDSETALSSTIFNEQPGSTRNFFEGAIIGLEFNSSSINAKLTSSQLTTNMQLYSQGDIKAIRFETEPSSLTYEPDTYNLGIHYAFFTLSDTADFPIDKLPEANEFPLDWMNNMYNGYFVFLENGKQRQPDYRFRSLNSYGVSEVPEPSILTLYVAGLFGLGFVRRRQA